VIVRGKADAEVEFGNLLVLGEQSDGLIIDWELFMALTGRRPAEIFFSATFQPPSGKEDELHHGDTGMRGYDLPAVVKFLEIHGAISHHVLLGTRESDRPPGEG
jgi:hypothetical protein